MTTFFFDCIICAKLLTGTAAKIDMDIGDPFIAKDNLCEYIKIFEEAGLLWC